LDKADEKIQIYSCPDCRPREVEIKKQAKRIEELEYTISVQKELIENLRGGNEVKKENLSSDSSQFGEGAKGYKAS
jgi:hypothetical protein